MNKLNMTTIAAALGVVQRWRNGAEHVEGCLQNCCGSHHG